MQDLMQTRIYKMNPFIIFVMNNFKYLAILPFVFIFSCAHYEPSQYEHSEILSVDNCYTNELDCRINVSDTVWVELPNGMVLPKIDSLYYWDDMVFSENGLYYLCPVNDRSAVQDVTDYYWPYSVVPYKYNANIVDTTRFRDAMNHIEINSGVKFRPKISSDTKYIEFCYNSSITNSYVGMQSGGQIINIQNIYSMRDIVHEILHSLGFFHEHCRQDRDSYIRVNLSNIKEGKKHNFRKYTDNGMTGLDLGPLDFNSIMIYSSYTTDTNFVFDTSIATMLKLNGDPFYQGTSLSDGDKKGIRSVYGPPFHRLEHHRLRVVEDEVSGFIETFITENSDSIVFYADKACTIRQSLPYPRRIKIFRTICTDNNLNYSYEYNYYTVTIPSGVSSYCLWNGFNYECYNCSNPSNYRVTTHEIVNKHITNDAYFFHE